MRPHLHLLQDAVQELLSIVLAPIPPTAVVVARRKQEPAHTWGSLLRTCTSAASHCCPCVPAKASLYCRSQPAEHQPSGKRTLPPASSATGFTKHPRS